MNIRQFYLKEYPSDDIGFDIDYNATFIGLLDSLHNGHGAYEYIGVADSLVRERLFLKLADMLGVQYDYIFDLWLK